MSAPSDAEPGGQSTSSSGPANDSLGFFTKFWFGFGQSAEGMKNVAFGTFLMLFYSQVLGLPAYLAGLALAVSLGIDAITDPITGSLSDALRHRWGRRHPFMYAAAIPMGVTFALVFRPPSDLGDVALFAWMLTLTVLARLAMTLYHVPHLALGAELSTNYHERTVVVAYRTLFGLVGAAVMILFTRQVLMAPTEAFPDGQLNPAAYPVMGVTFGLAMAVAILLSALGTHSSIPRLPVPPEVEPFSTRRLLREMREALQNHSFRNFFMGLLVFYIARGVEGALSIYMGTFFWQLETGDVLLIPAIGLLGVVLGTPGWALVARHIDKRSVFMIGLVWFSVLTTVLPPLQILGFYFPRESSLYVSTIYWVTFFAAAGAAGPILAAGSMLADIADEHEASTGRRQEGIFFGAFSFSGKAAVGLGSAIAGAALSLIAFPTQVDPSAVPSGVVQRLGIIAGPGVAGLMVVGIVLMGRYQLTKDRLEAIQAELFQRRESA